MKTLTTLVHTLSRAQKALLAMVVATCLFVASCGGPLGRLEDSLTLAPSFINTLVITNVISQALGDKLNDDFKSGKASADAAKAKLATLPESDKSGRSLVYVQLGKEWQAVIARNHFAEANNPKVNAVVDLISEIITIVINNNSTQAVGARGASAPVSDIELNKKIDQLNKLLKGE